VPVIFTPMNQADSSSLGYRFFHTAWFLFVAIHLTVSMKHWEIVGVEFLNSGNHFIRACSMAALPGCLAAIAFPWKRWLALATLSAWSLTKLDALPAVPNHIVLALAVNLLFVGMLLSSYRRGGEAREALGEIFARWAPVGRGLLVVLYFWTIFHKLNVDFFRPETSCAAVLYREIAERVPLFPVSTSLDVIIIAGTFLVELALPILFAVPRWRPWGILIGLPFHLALAVHSNPYILSFTAEISFYRPPCSARSWSRAPGSRSVSPG